MGCSIQRVRLTFGPLKAQSTCSVFVMLLIFSYLFYCLTGYCDSMPRPLYDDQTSTSNIKYDVKGTAQNRIGVFARLPPPELGARNISAHLSRAGLTESEKHHLTLKATGYSQHQTPENDNTQGDVANQISVFNNMGAKKFPQAIIIGVKKGGTRALLEFLRIHPDVRAVGAEPHFFDRFYERGLEWYRNLMPRTLDGQITMEKTPSYFVTKEAPRRVFSMGSNTKLIVVVRNPVTRAVSDYTQTKSKNPGLPTFQDLAFKNQSGGLVDTAWSAVRIGIYAKHLENWLRYFPLSSFLFVSGERLVTDPAGEMGRVQDFLGLKRVVSDKHFYFNQTKGFPCLKKPEGSSHPRCLGKSKGRPHPLIPHETLCKLGDFYRSFNLKFYQMSGQDFGWD